MQRCRFVGIPGSGKTHRAMQVIAQVRERGFSFQQIGYCTFTRAARREASQRAADEFGVSVLELERHGWFRTIHSAVMRLLGVPRGSIVNFDQEWLQEALDDDRVGLQSSEDDEDAWINQWRGQSVAATALGLWDIARQRLVPFRAVYDDAVYRSGCLPGGVGVDACEAVIERYEEAKARDTRIDFTDCILAYAGRRMTVDGPQEIEPRGNVPPVPVWLFDEAQDTSPLLDLAARRLSSEALWYYLLGDPLQGIYGWSGGNPRAFMSWPVVHQEYLRKTWRCSREIIELGLRLIYKSDEFTRELRVMAVEPRCDGGTVEVDYQTELLDHVADPALPTLVMARTNRRASLLQSQLSTAGIPWTSVRGSQRWPPLASTRTCDAFAELEGGGMIDGDAWRRIVAAVPVALLQRGTKARFKPAESKDEADFVTLLGLNEYGGTDALKEVIGSGRWAEPIEGVVGPDERCAHGARKKWGDLAANPKIQVSTIHGTKGLEADKVILCTGIDGPVLRGLRTEEGIEEERRTWYVGATRARDHLVLLKDQRSNYQDLLDVV